MMDINHETLTDDELLDLMANLKREADYYQREEGKCQQEIARRLDERQSTVIPSNKYIFEWPIRYEYPQGCFTPLKEVLSETELAECHSPEKEVVIPEHTETVPESWNTQKALSIAKKRGPEVLGIIERNRIPKRSKPKFERRQS